MTDEEMIRVERFNGANFKFWKIKIKEYMYQKDLYFPLSGKAQKLKEMYDDEWDILDWKALGAIWLSLASIVAFNVSREKTTQDLMAALSKMYEKLSASNKIFLMKKLFNLEMEDSGSVAEHLNEFNALMSQLESVEINFDNKIRVLVLLSSLVYQRRLGWSRDDSEQFL